MRMQKVEQTEKTQLANASAKLPVSVIVAARNEEKNLPRCLAALREVGEVYVIDSQSTDATPEIARTFGAKVVQFHYQGGWPKKRQWAMENLPFAYDWIFLVDADEALTPELAEEIRRAIQDPAFNGYYISLRMYFLGQSSASRRCQLLETLTLPPRQRSLRMPPQRSGSVHGRHGSPRARRWPRARRSRLEHPLIHHNVESLSHYIQKHDEYSNWEARVLLQAESSRTELPPAFFGTQAQRRRWLKKKLFAVPGSPVLLFFYRYFLRLGFLDGVPGLIYCGFQAVQIFHTKAKIYELKTRMRTAR